MNYFLKIVLLTLLFINQLASAGLKKLLDSPTRPTIADVEREMSPKNFPQVLLSTPNLKVSYVRFNAIDKLIAELEWAYPGAIYMPLGRDVVILGDIIDAFYRSQGQPGRVIRLNASGPSLNVSEEMIARFVQSSGVDIKNLKKSPGYIIFDGSSYNLPNQSQSTKILNAVYKEYVRQGGKEKDLLTKFAFFNLFSQAFASVTVEPNLDRKKFLREQLNHLKNNSFVEIPNKTFAASESSYAASEWHLSFGLLQEMPDGTVAAALHPSDLMPLQWRQQILKEVLFIMTVVETPTFRKKVRQRAKELGYDFKIRRKKKSCYQVIGGLS